MIKDQHMDDRTAVLLAMADCRDNPAALRVCEMFLRMFPAPHRVTFADMSTPFEED